LILLILLFKHLHDVSDDLFVIFVVRAHFVMVVVMPFRTVIVIARLSRGMRVHMGWLRRKTHSTKFGGIYVKVFHHLLKYFVLVWVHLHGRWLILLSYLLHTAIIPRALTDLDPCRFIQPGKPRKSIEHFIPVAVPF
jgi:uncharacterized membrane protein (UPF0182 family)